MRKKAHFKALINLSTTEDGGTTNPLSSGFRGVVRFPFDNREFFANHTFGETELIFAGDSATVEITLVQSDDVLEKLYEGLAFELSMNSNVIGSGVVTQLYY